MSELIAVTHSWAYESSEQLPILNQLALLFDRIAIVDSGTSLFFRHDVDALAPYKAAGIVTKLPLDAVLQGFETDSHLRNAWSSAVEHWGNTAERLIDHVLTPEGTLQMRLADAGEMKDLTNATTHWLDSYTRLIAVGERVRASSTVIPFLSQLNTSQPEAGAGLVPVIRVVLERMPFPDSSVALQTIADFREDRDAMFWMAGLRTWMHDIARGSLSPAEISDKCDWLMQSYKRNMDIHRLKYRTGRLELAVVTVAEIAEQFLTLRWSSLARQLFSVRKEEIRLLEAEMATPGRELAYLIRVNQRFRTH